MALKIRTIFLVSVNFLIFYPKIGFENGKTQLFKSGGVVKLAYFQKKWSIPLRLNLLKLTEKIGKNIGSNVFNVVNKCFLSIKSH